MRRQNRVLPLPSDQNSEAKHDRRRLATQDDFHLVEPVLRPCRLKMGVLELFGTEHDDWIDACRTPCR